MVKEKKQELAINVKKEENISLWYTQVIQKADLMDYTKVSGCIVFKPNSYQIWEKIQSFFNEKIKKSGVKNVYFPLLIPQSLLMKEKDHVEGFTPEVAWVTQAGNSDLSEKLAIRPTSETLMYDSYSKWINSYRDLPLRLNQWCSVVRWEFKHPTPFMRNREFLWQEGHTAFALKEEADREVLEILDYYKQIYEDLLAIPVSKGRKSVGEKFAGADYTTTVEMIDPEAKSIQGGTSHHLGQNFAKAFDITYLDKNQKKQYVYQNSWGITTRTLAAMILIHGDDKGLIIPPRVAENKIVIVPLLFKGKEEFVLKKAFEIKEELEEFGIIIDDRDNVSAGFKFNEWELKGIPIRIEIGPKDIENSLVQIVRRDTFEKFEIKFSDIKKNVLNILEDIHKNLFEKAKDMMAKKTVCVYDFESFEKAILENKRCLVPWEENIASEDEIKQKTGAKSSCIPFEFKEKSLDSVKCFYSGNPATCWAYFSKSH
ncbi:proline--tRNA ligase [bacterium]|nr:proline--tRNA ligase [bacterium]